MRRYYYETKKEGTTYWFSDNYFQSPVILMVINFVIDFYMFMKSKALVEVLDDKRKSTNYHFRSNYFLSI